MFKQFPEIPSRFIHTDKVKGVKTPTYFVNNILSIYINI